jgi:hypothetical protein
MMYVYFRPPRDEELRHHLQNGETITFTDAVKNWEAIERQVERLGFEDAYAVSRAGKPYFAGLQRHTRVSPLRMPPRALPRLDHNPPDRSQRAGPAKTKLVGC